METEVSLDEIAKQLTCIKEALYSISDSLGSIDHQGIVVYQKESEE